MAERTSPSALDPGQRLVRAAEICRDLGISPGAVRKWVRAGKLPSPQYIAGRAVWPLDTYLRARERLIVSSAPQPAFTREHPHG